MHNRRLSRERRAPEMPRRSRRACAGEQLQSAALFGRLGASLRLEAIGLACKPTIFGIDAERDSNALLKLTSTSGLWNWSHAVAAPLTAISQRKNYVN